MKLSDYIRIGLTAGIAFNVCLEAGKWTAFAITLLLVGGEFKSYLMTRCLNQIDRLRADVDDGSRTDWRTPD